MLALRNLLMAVLVSCGAILAADADNKNPVYDDPAKVDNDFAYQGEYSGSVGDGQDKRIGVQIIALGNGKFHGVGYTGGLPGDGWTKTDKIEADGELKDGVVVFKTNMGGAVVRSNGTLELQDEGGTVVGELKKVNRESETLGAKPPEGAVVLFDGKNVDHFPGSKMTPDGLLMQGATSRDTFRDCKLHVEFRLPYQPTARGQGRGNSGCYLQGRYEVQMLDSFGLEGKDNECGGIYSIKSPDLNMCLPPLSWQTYDIDYTAAKFDDSGKKTANARITVRHNNVVIHDNVDLGHGTTAAPVKEGPEPGPIFLQDHGNPVRYRNIWVLAK